VADFGIFSFFSQGGKNYPPGKSAPEFDFFGGSTVLC